MPGWEAIFSLTDRPEDSSARFVRRMVLLNLVALVAAYMSGHWDAAMHARGEVEQFWYPPHYGIYFALGVAAGVSIAGFVSLLRAPGSLGTKVRRHPALATVAAANAIGFTGAPFDAWWHEVFGIDLSVWSPPHLHLLFGMVLAALAGAVYFLDDAPVRAAIRPLHPLDRRTFAASMAVVIGLLLAAFLFFEYEAGLTNAELLSRPPWTYPILWTAFAVFAVVLPTALLRFRGASTLVAALYVVARLLVLGVDQSLLGFEGAVPYPLLLPAIAVDATLFTAWARGGSPSHWPVLAATGLSASVLVVLSAPPFWSTFGNVPSLTVDPWTPAWPVAIVAGVLGAFAGRWTGTSLRRLRPRAAILPLAIAQADAA